MVKMLSLIFLFFTVFFFCHTMEESDTLQNRMTQFYRIAGIERSDNGRLIGVKKLYSNNNDTIMLFDTKKPNTVLGSLTKKNTVHFLDDESILSFGNDNAEYCNFKTTVRKEYQNVKKVDLLKSEKLYFILKKDGTFSAYDRLGRGEVKSISKVQDFFISEKYKSLFIQYENGDLYKISEVLRNQTKKLYSTNNKINDLMLSPTGRQLIFTESDNSLSTKKVFFIDTETNKIMTPTGIIAEEWENFSIDEINHGKAYFIVGTKKIDKPKSPEVWYGNDGNLINTQLGYELSKRYWIWRPDNGRTYKLPYEKYSSIYHINNSRYFLCFNKGVLQNYLSYSPNINLNIYDAETETIHNIGIASQSIIKVSNNGTYLIYVNTNKQWVLCNIETQEKMIIEGMNLNNPKFSFDDTLLFFESNDGLWAFSIKNKMFQPLNIGKGMSTTILNNNRSSSSEFHSYIEKDTPLLLKITDMASNRSSYGTLLKGVYKEVIASNSNKISEMSYNRGMQEFWTIEENYHIPPKLLYKDNKRQKKQIIYKSNLHDVKAPLLKQEKITYTSSDGTSLKGLLYYPEDYNPSKKYPMVVHIYQRQSSKFNDYSIPEYNSIGFDLRTMLERGYFVYMPDTIVGSSGPGLSALDCVNKALDAVCHIIAIDIKKMGLIGHSFGGYETNFIATHSGRFATYISGAGHSDIVRAYFSFNYNFHRPFYFQFENGIYDMKPFAEDKDLYAKNNPINYVEKVNKPILLWAGKNDRNVPWEHSVEFYTGLKRNNKQVLTLLYPNGGHDLGPNTDEAKDLHVRILDWWDYFLKDKKDVGWINKQIIGDTIP